MDRDTAAKTAPGVGGWPGLLEAANRRAHGLLQPRSPPRLKKTKLMLLLLPMVMVMVMQPVCGRPMQQDHPGSRRSNAGMMVAPLPPEICLLRTMFFLHNILRNDDFIVQQLG